MRMTSSELPPVAVFDNYWGTTLAFARSLGAKGVPLHFYGSGAGRWSRYRTRHFRCPPIENSRVFEPWLLENIRSGAIGRIAPTTDLIAYYAAKFRDEFPAETRCMIASLQEIETCLIKTRFASVCGVSGHSSLATIAPDDPDIVIDAVAQLGYPVMLKPKSHLVVGFAERGRLIENVAQLRKRYRPFDVAPGQEDLAERYPELRWPLIQRYVPSAQHRVYSVSGIKGADGAIAATVSYKREQWPPNVGTSIVQVGCDDPRILAAGLDVVDRLLSRGIFEIELLADGEQLYAIDLNPRAFGFLALDIARGVDLPWLWFRSTIERVAPMIQASTRTTYEARHRLLHFIARLRGRAAVGPREVAGERRDAGRRRSSISMLGDWRDPLPMLISHLHLLRHPRSLVRSPRS